MSESEAIKGAKQGNRECFQSLYALHKKRVSSLCFRMIGNIEAAEDLTQEVFLLVFRKIATYRGDSAFYFWLQRLTVNVVLMHMRRHELPEVSLEETLERDGESGTHKEFAIQDKILAGAIDRVTLERFIESLPPGYRQILVLHDINGYEHNEIATLMGCCEGNSKSQLHKARLKLRTALSASCAGYRRRRIPQEVPLMLTPELGDTARRKAA
jgi:RNA polymerase sigma-70 factor (ECF subfamily)